MGLMTSLARFGAWTICYAQINQVGVFGPDAAPVELPCFVRSFREYILSITEGLSGLAPIGDLSISQCVGATNSGMSFVDTGNMAITGAGCVISASVSLAARPNVRGIANVFDTGVISPLGSELFLDPKTSTFKKKYVGPAGGDTYFIIASRIVNG